MSERPAGWYRDPDNPKQHRYWDGQAWASTGRASGQPSENVIRFPVRSDERDHEPSY